MHIHVDYDTTRGLDPTMWLDYIVGVEYLAFTLFLLAVSVATLVMFLQKRRDILLKGPIRITLMCFGAWLHVTGEFVTNKSIDSLDPIRNFHCTTWDFWFKIMGFAIWYAFLASSLTTSIVRSMGIIGALFENASGPAYVTVTPVITTMPNEEAMEAIDLQADSPMQEEGTVDHYTIVETHTPDLGVRDALRHWWRRVSFRKKMSVIPLIYGVLVLGAAVLICGLAEIPGVTTYHSSLNECLTSPYYKTFVVIPALMTFAAFLWVLYLRLQKGQKIPLFMATNYRNIIVATTLVLLALLIMNVLGLISFWWGRSLYLNVLMFLYTFCLFQLIGRSLWDLVRNTRDYDNEIYCNMQELRMPVSVGDVLNNAMYMDTVMPEFLDYISNDPNRYFTYRTEVGGVNPYFNPPDSAMALESMARYTVTENHPLNPKRMISLYRLILDRKHALGEGSVYGDTDGAKKIADNILEFHLTNMPSSLRITTSMNYSKFSELEEVCSTVPMGHAWEQNIKLAAGMSAGDLDLFGDVERWIRSIMDTYWARYSTDHNTMRHLRQANNTLQELALLEDNTNGIRDRTMVMGEEAEQYFSLYDQEEEGDDAFDD